MKNWTVNRIEWMDKDNELMLFYKDQAGHFSYESRIFLPASLLNKILMEIQKQNGFEQIDAFLKIEQWSDAETNFVFDFSKLDGEVTWTVPVEAQNQIRQIRA
ncbi:MAG: hypothetical protein N4A41_06070 [Crocinitomicaceae bacterium]|jgi:hypothetical protein|nr:hypothetical protein [Crocinitomicaceae bacterium]